MHWEARYLNKNPCKTQLINAKVKLENYPSYSTP